MAERKITLRNKISTAMVLVILFVGLAITFIISQVLPQVLINQTKQRGISMARNLAARSATLVLTEDFLELKELADEEKELEEDAAYAFVMNSKGDVLAHTFKEGFPRELKEANKVSPDQISNIQFLDTDKGFVYDIAAPLLIRNEMIGIARIGIAKKNIQGIINNTLGMVIGALILVVFISLFIGFALADVIVKPIKKLHYATEKMARGNLDVRMDIKTGDEIQQLAEAFNLMSSKLKESYTGLEEKVAARTKELKAAQERLLRSEKLATVGKLAGIMGHEIRNPLGVIRNSIYFLNMKLKESLDEKVKKHLDILQAEIGNCDKIISGVLDFARLKAPALAKGDINRLVKETLSKAAIPERVRVQTDLEADLPEVQIDTEQIKLVFSNLISNALQAMPEGGELKIITSRVDKFIAIAFKDTGCGLPRENLTKIFEPLFSTKAKGVGLGLAACQTIIEGGHQGKIEVESEVNKGATFTVKLPIA